MSCILSGEAGDILDISSDDDAEANGIDSDSEQSTSGQDLEGASDAAIVENAGPSGEHMEVDNDASNGIHGFTI